MSLSTQYEFLFVGRDEGNFVENYAYDLGEGGETNGKIFINLEIQNNPADAEMIGETMFDAMRKSFFADPEKEEYVRFEESVKAVNKALREFAAGRGKKFLGNINAIIATIIGGNLYLTQTGDAEAYLMRRRLCSTISEGLSDEESEDVFTNIASGTLESGDLVLINTTRLLRYISKTDLAKVVSGRNLISTLAELKDELSGEVLNKVGLIAVNCVENGPNLDDQERGKVVAHLQKEEMNGSPAKSEKRDSMVVLKDTIANLSRSVDDLRRRVAGKGGSKGGGRIERGSSGSGSGFKIGNMGKDKLIPIFILVVVALTVGVWWLRGRALEQAAIENYDKVLTEVREEIASAETTGQYNKDQAGEMLAHAEKKALEVLNSGYHRAKANELLKGINETKDKLDGVIHPETKVLVDLATKRSNVSALGLLGLKGTLYAYEYNALYPIVLDKIQDPLTIDENETVIGATIYPDKDSLMFYTKSGKVIEYADNRMTFVDSADGAFHKGVDVRGYSNKLYILDPEGNQIWRYARRRDKFDAAEAYNVNADIKNGLSLAIDGSVYVLNKDGFITKLFSGNQEQFPIKKQPVKPMAQPTKIYTELDMPNIYILEPAERRVLVYAKDDKTGGATYLQQFVFDDMPDLRDLFVDKDTNRLYVMDSTKVYQVNL
ncbi:hypothetical protein IT413_04990 [Candidatus Peregrinibacteria bacterium]|nr:hypothetical protein [Candidatus Peregrinibacteria bacterium]